MNRTEPPKGTLDPQQPWYKGGGQNLSAAFWDRFKAKLTGGTDAGGTSYFSMVKVTSAEADKIIANMKKDPRGYPQMDQGNPNALYDYQNWIVEEYLEGPFREEVNDKIEQAALNSQYKQLAEKRKKQQEQQAKKEAAKSFVSSSSTLRPGKRISVKTTRMGGIIPKRSVPKEIADKISAAPAEESTQAAAPKAMIASLGRLTLDLEYVNNNLDKITEIIKEDYAQTKVKNKKEIEEYRKRAANRERRIVKKDLGDNKRSLKEIIKPFVGGFFSGIGGGIRALASFNLLDAIINGDIGKIFQSMLGIGITFLPQIGMLIAGQVIKSMFKGLGRSAGRRVFGGPRMRGPRGGRVPRMGGLGKFAAMATLGTAALSLGSAYMNRKDGESSGDALDELEAQEKALAAGGYAAITDKDLERFQQLNEQFSKTLDVLLGNKKFVSSGGGGGTGSASPDKNTTGNPGGGDPKMTGQEFQTDAGMDKFVKEIYGQAEAAGAKHPILAAAIASLETSYGKKEYGNNPFNMKGTAGQNMDNKGFLNFDTRADATKRFVQLWDKSHSGYTNLDAFDDPNEAFAAIVNSYAPASDGNDPGAYRQFVADFIKTYGPTLQSKSRGGVASVSKQRSVEISASTPSRGVLVNMIPTPTEHDGVGGTNIEGGLNEEYIDPDNANDVLGMLYRTQMNIIELG